LAKQLQECEDKSLKMESENEELTLKLTNIQSNKQQEQSTITQLQEEIESTTMECQREKELHQMAKTKLDSVTLEMNEILVKNLQLMTELSDNKSTIISLRTQINRLKSSAIKPSAVMSSELENLRNKCSALEMELSELKKEQQSIEYSEAKDKNITSIADSRRSELDSQQEKHDQEFFSPVEESDTSGLLRSPGSPPSLTVDSSSECDTASIKSTSSSSSSNSDSMLRQNKQGKDRHILSALAQENQTLKQRLSELEAVAAKQNKNDSDAIPWLQRENKRLLDLLQQAKKEALDNQVQERVACIKNRVLLIDRYIKFFSNIHKTLGCVLFEKVKY